jgi:hypothetical protein
MNAQEVIDQHRKWKERFMLAMAKSESMSVAEISVDNLCIFGKWLHGEAKDKFGSLASYADCVAKHAAFHVEAGKVAQKINDGDRLAASQQLVAHDTPYQQASEALSKSVIAMFREAEGAG